MEWFNQKKVRSFIVYGIFLLNKNVLDKFQVRDGYWYKSDLLVKVCGSTPPPSIISTGEREI